ncbi:uncharacterized protein LOC118435605 [Folsomia candida]|uniref:Putative gustatory receptor 23a, isoforms A/C n=1 Tax=Folsomia candida TaxID=158441 RepID=A0A226ECX5_FOLCA|nr:uncharacterized protein LOC118435605 [Folsomia candida]OXA54621.1 putative gustatory receptor 23a, isoforms A/C [Folsomia candida]
MISLKESEINFDKYYTAYEVEIPGGKIPENAPTKTGTSENQSLLAAVTRESLWPLRISQISGFFPIPIHPRKNCANLSAEIYLPATFSLLKTPSVWWTLFLIALTFFPIISYQADAERFDDYSVAFESMGRNTFRTINLLWILLGNGCPFLARVDVILQRKRFIAFWTNFLDMLRQFDTTLDKNNILSPTKFGSSLRKKFFVHVILNFAAVLIGMYGGLMFAFQYEGKIFTYIMGILQDGFSMMLAVMQVFGFTLMIFFLMVYNHCLAVILNMLEKKGEQNRDNGVEKLIKLYKLVDDQVHEFNGIFNYKMVLEVLYNFMSILFYGYFLILFTKMGEIFVFLINVVNCLFLLIWFVWFGKECSEVAGKSREIGRKLAYLGFGGNDTMQFVSVQKIGAQDSTNYQKRGVCKTAIGYIQSCPLTIETSIFDLNLKLLLSIFAAILTYVVIIVQFQSVDRS